MPNYFKSARGMPLDFRTIHAMTVTDDRADMTAFKSVLKTSEHITVLAGAGLSAASGIPTFRGAGGLWRQYDALSLATPEAFRQNPARSWVSILRRGFATAKSDPLSIGLLRIPETEVCLSLT